MTPNARTRAERHDTKTGTPLRRYQRPLFMMDSALVYFIQEPLAGCIKIGVTSDIHKRIERLQTSHPHRLVLLGTCAGGITLERKLHREFAKDRLTGEWFSGSEGLHSRIRELCQTTEGVLALCEGA